MEILITFIMYVAAGCILIHWGWKNGHKAGYDEADAYWVERVRKGEYKHVSK